MRKLLSFAISAAVCAAMLINTIPRVDSGAESEKTKLIALTFDDGPNTTTTNDVLDVLEEYNAKASFFLIGNNINDESAESVKRAYDMGMEIDNHSKSHGNMSKMSEEEVKAEISYVDDKVKEITGESTKFFRPPYIDVSDSLYDAVGKPFICGIDCQDFMANVTAQERADYILNGAKDGVIVLLHDAAGNQQTVEALKIAMPQLVEQGYEFVTLTELFERQGETPKGHILYSNVAKYPCADYQLKQEISSEASGRIALDQSLLSELGSDYAIEVNYTSATAYPPVIALQRWSSTPSIWHVIQPFYFNGEKAVFLAEDVLAALKQLELDYLELDGISLAAYTGEITLEHAKILVKSEISETSMGDVNRDGVWNLADAVALQKFLLAMPDAEIADWNAADFDNNHKLNALDLCLMKHALLNR